MRYLWLYHIQYIIMVSNTKQKDRKYYELAHNTQSINIIMKHHTLLLLQSTGN